MGVYVYVSHDFLGGDDGGGCVGCVGLYGHKGCSVGASCVTRRNCLLCVHVVSSKM